MKTIIYLTVASLLAVPVLAFAYHEGRRHEMGSHHDKGTHHKKRHEGKKHIKDPETSMAMGYSEIGIY